MVSSGRTIILSETAAEVASRRAIDLGFSDVGKYIETLIAEEARTPGDRDPDDEHAGPKHLSPETHEQLETLLLEGLASPTRPMTNADWSEMRAALIARHHINKEA